MKEKRFQDRATALEAKKSGMGENNLEPEYKIFDARQAIPAGPVQKLEPAKEFMLVRP
ncbi:hypothetical protein ACTVH1_16995 [Gluconobacter cerinus]